MTGSKIRRSMPLFPIGPVMQLTELTARQIRYYEERQLISPARTTGNRRMFSLNDIDRLLEIKDLIDQGVNIAGIKKFYSATVEQLAEEKNNKTDHEISKDDVRRLLRKEFVQAGRFNRSLSQGNIHHYFH